MFKDICHDANILHINSLPGEIFKDSLEIMKKPDTMQRCYELQMNVLRKCNEVI